MFNTSVGELHWHILLTMAEQLQKLLAVAAHNNGDKLKEPLMLDTEWTIAANSTILIHP